MSIQSSTREDHIITLIGLHYSIWKIVAKENDLAAWLSIRMSLPFMHGSVNVRWKWIIDVMLEEKRGVREKSSYFG